MASGDSLLCDLDFPADIPGMGNRRLSRSVLAADDRSMKEGSVGKVSGEPFFVPDERSDEAPVERPREESDPFSVSRATEAPEGRFATGWAISVTGSGRRRWDGAAADAEEDDARLF